MHLPVGEGQSEQGAEPGRAPARAAPARAAPGRRGAATRTRLMAAAREMLKSASPIELTAIGIARAAGVAPPSFYVYFADTRDLLLALSEEAATELAALARHFEVAWPPEDLHGWATAFVEDFVATWSGHGDVLAARNLEADRGDPAFDDSRVNASLPVLEALCGRILDGRPAGSRRVEAFAEAVIHYAVLERLASVEGRTRPIRLQSHHYKAAMARMLSATLGAGARP